MAIDPNTGLDQSAQNNQPQMTEEQIRAMRGDLNPPAGGPSAEPQLSVPPASTNTTKVIFDGEEPAFSPNTLNQMPSSVDALIANHSSKKTLLWTVGGIMLVAILGAVGYFIVYPMLAVEPAPIVEVPVTPQPPAPPVRTSQFTVAPTATASIVISGPLAREALTAGITKESTSAPTGVTELVFSAEGGTALPLGPLFSALLPGFTEVAKTNILFEDTFTAFIYKDQAGAWPGYVATLKPGFDAAALKAWFTSLEKSPLKEFFVNDPGTMSAFKDGMINEIYPDRYATGATAGASFGYVMLPEQQKVVLSTSFAGLKEALRLLGL